MRFAMPLVSITARSLYDNYINTQNDGNGATCRIRQKLLCIIGFVSLILARIVKLLISPPQKIPDDFVSN